MAGKDNSSIAHIDAEEINNLTFEQLCSICQVNSDFVIELISYGTVEPAGASIEEWRFDTHQIQIIRRAVRLHHDLEVNHAGIALAIDLLSEIDEMRKQLISLDRYFSQRKTSR